MDERANYTILAENSSFLVDWAVPGYGLFIGCPSTIAAGTVLRLVLVCSWSLATLEEWTYSLEAESRRNNDSLILTFLDYLVSLNEEVVREVVDIISAKTTLK